MKPSFPMAIATAAMLCAASIFGCDGGSNGGDEDTAVDTTPDTAGDATGDMDVVDDSDAAGDPDVETAPDIPVDEGRDCAGMYPGGPFGYKGSIAWNYTTGVGTWDGAGDYLENICMRNQDDVFSCVAPFYCSIEYDVLIYDFTAMWCPPCNLAASEENQFVTWMEEHGWRVAFMSMVEEDESAERPTLADANYWKTSHGIEGDVMWDYNWIYHTAPFYDTRVGEPARGWPTFLVVNPDNMLVWDVFSGWYGSPTTTEEFYGYILDIFEMGAANDPEYIP